VPEALPEDWAWQDLQLPLYDHLVRHSTLGIRGDIELGYICLPKQVDSARFIPAKWSRVVLDHAIDTARTVVRGIRAKRFQMNHDFDGRFDDFARICQTAAFIERDGEEADE
jgi:hypothetical protein